MKKTFIYSLSDPRTNEVRYIGKANDLNQRFKHHVSHREKTYKGNWICGLKNSGLLPLIEVVDMVPESEWHFWEQYYISQFKSWGFNLTNACDGGIGNNGWVATDETKLKMRNAQLGKTHTDEAKEKQRLAKLGGKLTEETKEKLRKANLGKKQPLEAIAKTAAANRGRKNTEEMKRLLSEKFKGIKIPKDVLERRAKSQSKPILQFDLNDNFLKEYPSLKAAKMDINPKSNGLSDALKGRYKTWSGFKWKYK